MKGRILIKLEQTGQCKFLTLETNKVVDSMYYAASSSLKYIKEQY